MSDDGIRLPHDQPVRDAVASDLADTLFVEAGAGSGKTTILVNRVCALVESGVDVRHIAAITFTEKAASELRVRVRKQLLAQPQTAAVAAALAELGDAPMSTLHSFARRLLTEHGVAVGVPPHFEVLDTVAEAIYLEERWRELAVDLFDEEGPLAAVMTRAAELGLKAKGVREIVLSLHESYDRLRAGRWEWPDKPVTLPPIDLTRVIDAVRVAPLDDQPEVVEYLERAIAAKSEGERIDILRIEGVLPKIAGKRGEPGAGGRRRECRPAQGSARRAASGVGSESAAVGRRAGSRGSASVPRPARARPRCAPPRRRPGRVSCSLPAHPDRRVPGHRSPSDRDRSAPASSRGDIADRAWSDDPLAAVDAGRLFFVGDPKQSIYRFRRADIDLYEKAQHVFADPLLHLTENFRSVASIVGFVNSLFGPWMESPDAVGQPAYTPLTAYIDDHDDSPSVGFVGDETTGVPAAEIRLHEADAVVRVIAQAKRDGWRVRDEKTDELRPGGLPRHRGADADPRVACGARSRARRGRHPASGREPHPDLEHTGGQRSPRRAERGRRPERPGRDRRGAQVTRARLLRPRPRDMAVGRAKVDGTATSDTHLAEVIEHPVGRALLVLSDLHRARHELSIGEMVRRVVDVCHLRELAFANVRPRDRWRRIDFFLAQARAFEEAGGSVDRGVRLMGS